MALPVGNPEQIAEIARCCHLQDLETSARIPWEPKDEQIAFWHLCALHQNLFAAKPRKVGFSAAAVLDDVLWTNAADNDGNRARAVFAIDSADKSREHFERAEGWANELEIRFKPIRSPPYALVFPGKSRMDFLTLGTDEPGRGGDIHRLHVTELPFAANPERAWHALRTACAKNARRLIETTIEPEPFTRDFWRGYKRDPGTGQQTPVYPEFVRKFFSVEDQRSYRLPMLSHNGEHSTHLLSIKDDAGAWKTAELLPEAWAFAQANGFTLREAAAWWLLDALPNLCGGDMLRLMHDYPQIEAHLLVATTGRAIEVSSSAAEVIARIGLHGMSGRRWELEVYVLPQHSSGSCYITVDTAYGIGKSRSVVLVVDIADGRILACFCSSTIETDDLARMAQLARDYYLRGGEGKAVKRRVDVIIENNGIGQETCKDAAKIGLPHTTMDQSKNHNDHGAHACVKLAKRQIETVHGPGYCAAHQNNKADAPLCPACAGINARAGKSIVSGPVELSEECDTLKKVGNRFEGFKDVIMCLGMALLKRQQSGIKDNTWRHRRYDLHHVHVEDRMAEQRRLDRWRTVQSMRR